MSSRALRSLSGMRLAQLLCGGWTALVLLFLYLPIGLLIVYSFNRSRLLTQWTGFTLDWYRKLAQSESLLLALQNSVVIAAVTTVLSVLLGTGAAWLLHRYRFPWSRALGAAVVVPVVIPEIIMGVSLMILFSALANPLNEALVRLDWPDAIFAAVGRVVAVLLALAGAAMIIGLLRRKRRGAAWRLICAVIGAIAGAWLYRSVSPWLAENFTLINQDGFGLGFATIIIAHVTFCFPFVLVAVQARLSGMGPALEEAAMDLGASRWQAFRLVIVPALLPAIFAGALMAFTLSMDEVIVTYFVKSPASETLPIKIFGLARKGLDPSLNAISALFVGATALLVIAGEAVRRSAR